MNRIVLVAAVASLGLVACDHGPGASPADATRQAAAPPVHPSAAPRAPAPASFGGGYKGAKWSMSPAQVEALFQKPVETGAAPGEQDLSREVFALPGPKGEATSKRLEAYFWNGKLARAVLAPHFTDDYVAGYDETYRALTKKYGPGTPVPGKMDPRTGALVDLVAWTDGETLIQLRVDRLPADKAKGRTDPRLFSSTQVIYTGLALAKERAKTAAPAPAATNATAPAPAKAAH